MNDKSPTGARLVAPKVSAGAMSIVLLDRVEPGIVPDYCTHGKVSCYLCDEWCWLGDSTYKVVASGEVAGLCLQCARDVLPKDARPTQNLGDHRRADGPHA